MIERLLERVALFARRRYWLLFVLMGLLVVGSIVSALRLRFDTEILNLLFELHSEQKTTLVLVTHDMAIAEMADRIIPLQDGRVVTSNGSQ